MKILNKEIKKGFYCTKEHLEKCGWVQRIIQGEYSLWEQAQEELYYHISSQLILGVYKKGASYEDNK